MLIAILLLNGGPVKIAEIKSAPLSIIDIAGPEAEKPAVQPVEKPKEIVAPEPVVILVSANEMEAGPVFEPSLAAAAGLGRSCEIGEALGKAFEAHVGLRQALADWVPQARSVSGAIMLWDGEWVAPETEISPASLVLIRRGVIEGIKAAPAQCLDEPIVGPRFVIVRGAEGKNSVLVLGSGAWAWRRILDYENERLLKQPQAEPVQNVGGAGMPAAT